MKDPGAAGHERLPLASMTAARLMNDWRSQPRPPATARLFFIACLLFYEIILITKK